MACAIYSGISNDCRDNKGGVKKFYITNLSNISAVTSASGVISGITMSGSSKFYTYEQEINSASATEAPTTNRQNGTFFVDQTVNIMLNKRAGATSYLITALAQANVAIIVEEANGKRFLYGEANGLSLETSSSMTGVAMGDRNGYELIFKGNEPSFAGEINSSAWSALSSSIV